MPLDPFTQDRLAYPRASVEPSSGLLSLDASQKNVRRLKFWSASEQARVVEVFRELYVGWHRDWGVAFAWADQEHAVRILNGRASVALDDVQCCQSLPSRMFGEALDPADAGPAAQRHSLMASELANAAWDNWRAKVTQLMGENVQDGDASPIQPDAVNVISFSSNSLGSGALQLAFTWLGGEWVLNLQPAQVKRVLGHSRTPASADVVSPPSNPSGLSKLSPLSAALAQRSLQVLIELQPVELSLGALQTLAVNDVVVLSHALDKPAVVRLRAGPHADAATAVDAEPLCSAWLGQVQGKLAVTLGR